MASMGESAAPTSSHDESAKQVERLRQHLIELDQEMEAESIRHELERNQMLTKINELEEALTRKNNGREVVDRSDGFAKQELEDQIVDYELQLNNMKLSVEMLESSMGQGSKEEHKFSRNRR